MILSAVNADLELRLPLAVADAANQQRLIDFMIDTDFDGQLALPASVVATFGMPFEQTIETTVSDGSSVWVNEHRAVIVWDGAIRIVSVLAMGRLALVGTALLAGHDLHARFVPGGEIRIEKVP
jgi:predicted aspartyl protease